MFPFTLNGRPTAVWRGDWYAGKGVATAVVRHHTGSVIEVFTTHVLCLSLLNEVVDQVVSCAVWEGRGHVYVS